MTKAKVIKVAAITFVVLLYGSLVAVIFYMGMMQGIPR